MQDDSPTYAMDAAVAPGRRRSSGGQAFAALLAFVLGAAIVAALAWHGELERYLPPRPGTASRADSRVAADAGTARTADNFAASRVPDAVGSMEARLAMLEDRFSRLHFEAEAASGNAGRAEALLIAYSARRLIDRGDPLGYVSDQLNLRFADAQPRAVMTITEFAANPVTIDQLTARLEALAPDLTNDSQDRNFWERTRQEVASLFVVRSDSPTLLAPAARIDRARLMLTARRIGNAIDEVRRLPGADAADKWIADAQRFDDAQRALDLLETTAMLEPRRMKDGSGQDIDQGSPLAAPTPEPTISPEVVEEPAPRT